MDETVIYSRRKLTQVPAELFEVAEKQTIYVLDLGYNILTCKGIECLGESDQISFGLDESFDNCKTSKLSHYDSSTAKLGHDSSRHHGSQPNTRRRAPARLRHLQVLYLGYNRLQALPPGLAALATLRELWLNCNAITTLPAEIGAMPSLETLSLDFNHLTYLDAAFLAAAASACASRSRSGGGTAGGLGAGDFWGGGRGHGGGLRRLHVRGNRLGLAEDSLRQPVPPEIGLLVSLELLDLAENRVSTLPASLGHLTCLRRLNLEGNPWRFPPQVIVDKGRQAVISYLQDELEHTRK